MLASVYFFGNILNYRSYILHYLMGLVNCDISTSSISIIDTVVQSRVIRYAHDDNDDHVAFVFDHIIKTVFNVCRHSVVTCEQHAASCCRHDRTSTTRNHASTSYINVGILSNAQNCLYVCRLSRNLSLHLPHAHAARYTPTTIASGIHFTGRCSLIYSIYQCI